MKFLGPPPLGILVAAGCLGIGMYGLFMVPPDEPLLAAVLMVVGFVAAWRLLSHSVSVNDSEVVIKSLLRKRSIPVEHASIAVGRSKRAQDHMWHGQVGDAEGPLSFGGFQESNRLGVWIYDLSGSIRPIQLGCFAGRGQARFEARYAKLASMIDQAAARDRLPELTQESASQNVSGLLNEAS